MGIRNFSKKYFSFNKRERNGVIALLAIIFLLTCSAVYLKSKKSSFSIKITPLTIAEKNKQGISNPNTSEQQIASAENKNPSGSKLFVFDPNLITLEQAQQLGFSEKGAKVLLNYRSKGGKFRTKEDLKKLFGVTEKLYAKLESYILIEQKTSDPNFENKFTSSDKKTFEKKIVEINGADSLALVSLNGIGPALSRRILIYRNHLGGFVSKDQLKEVYGLKDTLYNLFIDRISIDASKVSKIKINSASIDDLKKHAYLKFIIAQSIVNYRQKHGNYSSPADLLKVGSLSEELVRKLTPYLEF